MRKYSSRTNVPGAFLQRGRGNSGGFLMPPGMAGGISKRPSTVSYTALSLNHFDGADGATTFTDAVTGPAWTRTGSSALEADQAKFGATSLLLPNARVDGAYVTGFTAIPVTSSWTIECWTYNAVASAGYTFKLTSADGNTLIGRIRSINASSFDWLVNTTAGFEVSNSSFAPTPARAGATWEHLAYVRNVADNSWSVYFQGSRQATFTTSNNMAAQGGRVTFGPGDTGNATAAYCDEIRVVAAAVYTGATYTVPTSAFNPT